MFLFCLRCMYSQCTVCVHQRFLFCLSPYLFSEWHIVPQLCIQLKQSRVYSRKALAGCKASRRLGKQIRGLYRFLSKVHQPSKSLLSSHSSYLCIFGSGHCCTTPFSCATTSHHLIEVGVIAHQHHAEHGSCYFAQPSETTKDEISCCH